MHVIVLVTYDVDDWITLPASVTRRLSSGKLFNLYIYYLWIKFILSISYSQDKKFLTADYMVCHPVALIQVDPARPKINDQSEPGFDAIYYERGVRISAVSRTL